MRMKDIPATERPQEKLLYSGAESLTTSELLALIIRTGNQGKSAIQLAEEVISYSYSEAGNLRNIDVQELKEVEGIGVSKACSIVASMEFAKRINSESTLATRPVIRHPETAAALLMEEMRHLKQERLVALLLNVKCELESKEIISIGQLSSATIHPRDVFRPAIRKSAAAILLAHNHPSGDPTPSEDDIASTKRLAEVAELMGIRLVDHIIIGDGCYTSLRCGDHLM